MTSADQTPSAADAVLRDLRAREPSLHRPEFGTTRADVEAMIAADFFEVGASGRRYDRDFVLGVLEQRRVDPEPDDWITRDFACRELGPTTWLLTYTLEQGERVTRRATIWRRATQGWVALYHQGTLAGQDT
jgi:hypothetical protein